ncbi:MAG TPA: NAD(P)H-hydrate dehydratase [Sphingomicrobium sp.]|nr:NAD(P)H-hydrate dehydratase [Sphingomicrobium sp.]
MAEGDKHDHGRLLIVAGSRSLPGSALLCALAAMRAGAGKLQIATVESVAVQIGVAMPESRTIGMPESKDGSFAQAAVAKIAKVADDVDAVVAGPGMFATSAGEGIAAALLRTDRALALDAGVLRSMPNSGIARTAGNLPVLLPHSGELAALLGCSETAVEADPLGCGKICAQRYGAVTLVKGTVSHIVHPDGRTWTYRGGAPGLGVSGSGDTLAGIVGALLARGAEPLAALLWSVLLHGEAGEELSSKVGPVGFLAREIPDEIPALLAR